MSNDVYTNGHDTARKLNFGPGPAQLPLEVLENVQTEFLDYNGSGCNIIELSHRSSTFAKIIQDAEQDIRDLLTIPDSYTVLFLQGGATAQFSAIAMNFIDLKPSKKADYLVTGYWSEKAAKEAEKFGQVNLVVPKTKKYENVPSEDTWKLSDDASYFYYCSNETIHGIEISDIPSIVPENVPIVCDMSSNFLTRSFDITKYAVVFASAQKNFGASGLVLVIIRKDLVGKTNNKSIPLILDYKIQMDNASMYNTPPTYPIYIAKKMFEWTKRQGGIDAISQQSDKKSSFVYTTIDQSNGFYVNSIDRKSRSRVNIPLRICQNGVPDEKLESLFLNAANKSNMIELKGHRAVGGIRISLYNGMSVEQTSRLVEFMEKFKNDHSS